MNQLCRLCLEEIEENNYIPLFQTEILDQIHTYTTVLVKAKGGPFDRLCRKCYRFIKMIEKFRNRCMKANDWFLRIIEWQKHNADYAFIPTETIVRILKSQEADDPLIDPLLIHAQPLPQAPCKTRNAATSTDGTVNTREMGVVTTNIYIRRFKSTGVGTNPKWGTRTIGTRTDDRLMRRNPHSRDVGVGTTEKRVCHIGIGTSDYRTRRTKNIGVSTIDLKLFKDKGMVTDHFHSGLAIRVMDNWTTTDDFEGFIEEISTGEESELESESESEEEFDCIDQGVKVISLGRKDFFPEPIKENASQDSNIEDDYFAIRVRRDSLGNAEIRKESVEVDRDAFGLGQTEGTFYAVEKDETPVELEIGNENAGSLQSQTQNLNLQMDQNTFTEPQLQNQLVAVRMGDSSFDYPQLQNQFVALRMDDETLVESNLENRIVALRMEETAFNEPNAQNQIVAVRIDENALLDPHTETQIISTGVAENAFAQPWSQNQYYALDLEGQPMIPNEFIVEEPKIDRPLTLEEELSELLKLPEVFPSKPAPKSQTSLTEPEIPCKYCPRVCCSYDMWRIHCHTMHSDQFRPFLCAVCGVDFKLREHLDIHHNVVHLELRHAECDLCGKIFFRKAQLKNHVLIHLGVKRYKCHLCSAKFSIKTGLNKHLALHNNPLNYYTRKLTGKKTQLNTLEPQSFEKSYMCVYCGKNFTSSENRNSHEKNHSKTAIDLDSLFDCNILDILNEDQLPEL